MVKMTFETAEKWLKECAKAFELNAISTSEDREHWAAIYNAENARAVLAALTAANERAERAEAENVRLRGLLWYAHNEFTAISARSGAPLTRDGMTTCAEEWWLTLINAFARAIGDDAKTPWPSEEARRALEPKP